MCCVRATGLGNHLLCVTMIGRDKKNIAQTLASFPDAANCNIGSLDGGNGGGVYARMANHVWRRKVAHDKLILGRLKALNDLLHVQ